MKSFELKSRFFSRHGDSYNIPVNTVYYTESRVNTELNTYVKENIKSLNVFMNLLVFQNRHVPLVQFLGV